MRPAARLSYAVEMPDKSWRLVHKGKVTEKKHPSADAAEAEHSDREGKR